MCIFLLKKKLNKDLKDISLIIEKKISSDSNSNFFILAKHNESFVSLFDITGKNYFENYNTSPHI